MSVYTSLNAQDLQVFLAEYAVGSLLKYAGISEGIENTNYFVTTEQQGRQYEFVLTVFEVLGADTLPYYLELMAFLADRGVRCAQPILDRHGRYLQLVQNKPAALIQRLPGRGIARPDAGHCRQIGAALAKLHLAGQGFAQHYRNEPLVNSRDLAWCRQTAALLLPKLSAADKQLLNAELDYQNPPDFLPQGVIHADLFRDNALFSDDTLSGIIDFYYACHGDFLYDLAITCNDWCSRADGVFEMDLLDALLQGYQQQRRLTAVEKDYWPMAQRAAALRFWLSRLWDWHFPRGGELTHTKDPDVLKRILQQRIESPGLVEC